MSGNRISRSRGIAYVIVGVVVGVLLNMGFGAVYDRSDGVPAPAPAPRGGSLLEDASGTG